MGKNVNRRPGTLVVEQRDIGIRAGVDRDLTALDRVGGLDRAPLEPPSDCRE